jgi:hypothetical protein
MLQTHQRRKPTNLTLPEDVRQKARDVVTRADLSLSQYVVQLIRADLALRERTSEQAHAA